MLSDEVDVEAEGDADALFGPFWGVGSFLCFLDVLEVECGWAAIAKEADANKQTAPASDNPPI